MVYSSAGTKAAWWAAAKAEQRADRWVAMKVDHSAASTAGHWVAWSEQHSAVQRVASKVGNSAVHWAAQSADSLAALRAAPLAEKKVVL